MHDALQTEILYEGGYAPPNIVNECFARAFAGLIRWVSAPEQPLAIVRLTDNATDLAEAATPELSALPNAVQ